MVGPNGWESGENNMRCTVYSVVSTLICELPRKLNVKSIVKRTKKPTSEGGRALS